VLARLTAGVLGDPLHETVEFNWHGGETTLLPISFYERALWLQARFRRPGQMVLNSIQTNGTRLTPEWARFLRGNEFPVGVSVDGPPEIHDRYRRDIAGGPTFAHVLRGIALLREHDVSFSVIMVVDHEALEAGGDRIFDFFLEMGIREYALNFVAPVAQPDAPPGSPAGHYADPARVSAFLVRLYDRWREHGDPRIRIRELDALRSRLTGGPAGICTLAGGCFGALFRIEPNGDVGHCDYFAGDPRYTWGNVLTDDFAAIRKGSNLRARAAENERALAGLRDCPNFAVCNGWCPYGRYASWRHNRNHRADCCGLREAIDHIRLREAERTSRSILMAALPLEPQTAGSGRKLDLSHDAQGPGGREGADGRPPGSLRDRNGSG
jgi:serine-type anaerobic sulfatase-maturating enzyme